MIERAGPSGLALSLFLDNAGCQGLVNSFQQRPIWVDTKPEQVGADMNEVAQQRPRRRIPRRDRSPSVSRDRGFSVVEVVFTITLIGVVIVPLLEATQPSDHVVPALRARCDGQGEHPRHVGGRCLCGRSSATHGATDSEGFDHGDQQVGCSDPIYPGGEERCLRQGCTPVGLPHAGVPSEPITA